MFNAFGSKKHFIHLPNKFFRVDRYISGFDIGIYTERISSVTTVSNAIMGYVSHRTIRRLKKLAGHNSLWKHNDIQGQGVVVTTRYGIIYGLLSYCNSSDTIPIQFTNFTHNQTELFVEFQYENGHRRYQS